MRKKSKYRPSAVTIPFANKIDYCRKLHEDLHMSVMVMSVTPSFDVYCNLAKAFLLITNTSEIFFNILTEEEDAALTEGLTTLDETYKENKDKEVWQISDEQIVNLKVAVSNATYCLKLFSYEQLRKGASRTVTDLGNCNKNSTHDASDVVVVKAA